MTDPSATPRPPMPNAHVRAALTWIAIFPLVTIGMLALSPFTESWHPVLRSLVLTLIVVPLASYLVMPLLLRTHGRIAMARSVRRAQTPSSSPGAPSGRESTTISSPAEISPDFTTRK